MNQELVVTIVVGHAQFVRVLAAVFLHHVGDTGTEGALDAGQLLKYRVAGRVRRIAQVLLSDFKEPLRQRCARRSAGVHQLIRNLIRTIRFCVTWPTTTASIPSADQAAGCTSWALVGCCGRRERSSGLNLPLLRRSAATIPPTSSGAAPWPPTGTVPRR